MMLTLTARTLRRLSSPLRCVTSPASRTRRYATEANVVKSPFKDVDIPDLNLTDFVWERLGEWPDHTAIVCGITGRSYTYAQLRDRSRRFATSLQRTRLEPGSVLGVVLPNCPDYPAVVLGAVEAGLVVTTFNPGYNSAEIAKQMVDANPRVIVTFPEKHQQVVEAATLAGQSGYRPPLYVVVQCLERSDIPQGAVDAREMMEHNMDTIPLAGHQAAREAPTLIPYSSGTTGLPKGVMLSHRNLVSNSTQLHGHPSINLVEATSGNYQDRLPAILPFFHVYGLIVVLLSKMRLGVKIITLPRFEPKTFIDTIGRHKATVLYLAPPLVLFLGSHPDVVPDTLRSVRTVMSGAAPLGEKDAERFLERGPHISFLQGYGMTELSPVTNMNTKNSSKMASVGPCVPNARAKVIDVETGVALGPGKVGEVCFHGPQNMLGYHKNPKATAEMIDQSGWLHSGDLGYYDDDRDFYIVDRLKELIKVKGFQVAPAELEEILRTHPDIAEAAVIGIPDPQAGEAPLAYIVPKPSARSTHLERDIKEFVAGKVSNFKQIKEVRFVQSIPKNPSGKILRKNLRELYKNQR